MGQQGIPNTEEGWYQRLKSFPQYAHYSEEQLRQLAKDKLAGAEERKTPPVVQFDLDEYVKSDSALKKTFTRLWQQIFKDIEGPDSVREIQAKQYAFACLLYQRRMIEDWQFGRVGGQTLERLQMIVSRFAEQLAISPKHRKPGKGQEETLSDAIAGLEKARKLQNNETLEEDDRRLIESEPE